MNIYTLNRPVILRQYIDTDAAYSYVNYTVAYKYISDYTTLDVAYRNIYFGKAFVQIDGFVEIDITDVIRNYAYRPDYKYDISAQKWVPENLTDASADLLPVEDRNKWLTSEFVIKETDGDDLEINIPVTTLFFPEYYADDDIVNPYNADTSDFVPMVNYTGILPRIPWLYTDNYYFNLEAVLGGDNAPLTTVLPLTGEYAGDGEITLQGYGNYSNSFTLTQFYNLFTPPTAGMISGGGASGAPEVIEAGGADSTYPYILGYGASTVVNPGRDTVVCNGKGIVGLDSCPYRYYISWTTPFGEWQSQPLQSVAFTENSDNFSINTAKRLLNNIENRSEALFSCRSYKLTTDYYRLFNTLLYAPYVLLYDTEKDKSYYTVVDTNSFTVRDKSNSQKIIDFNLKQIRKTIN